MVSAKKILTLDWKLCYGASASRLENGRIFSLLFDSRKWTGSREDI